MSLAAPCQTPGDHVSHSCADDIQGTRRLHVELLRPPQDTVHRPVNLLISTIVDAEKYDATMLATECLELDKQMERDGIPRTEGVNHD